MSLNRLFVLLVALTLCTTSCRSGYLHGGRLRFDVLNEHHAIVDGWEADVRDIQYSSDERGLPAVAIQFESADAERIRVASSRAKGMEVAIMDPETHKPVISGTMEDMYSSCMFSGMGWEAHPDKGRAIVKRLREIAASTPAR